MGKLTKQYMKKKILSQEKIRGNQCNEVTNGCCHTKTRVLLLITLGRNSSKANYLHVTILNVIFGSGHEAAAVDPITRSLATLTIRRLLTPVTRSES